MFHLLLTKYKNEYEKVIIFITFVCVSLNGMSQISKTTQYVTKFDGRYKIKYNERYFDVDTTTITVKLADLKASYNIESKTNS